MPCFQPSQAFAVAPKYSIDYKDHFPEEKLTQFLVKAENHYSRAIRKMPTYSRYHNNMGVLLMAKARRTDHDSYRDRLFKEAYLCFQDAAKYDPLAYKPYLNMGDIKLRQIIIELQLNDMPFVLSDYLQSNQVNLDEEARSRISLNIIQAKTCFEDSRRHSGTFVNYYYKMAELLLYEAVFYKISKSEGCEKAVDDTLEHVRQFIDQADSIDDTVQGTKYVKRSFYDLVGEFSLARECNSQIENSNPGNAREWNTRLETFLQQIFNQSTLTLPLLMPASTLLSSGSQAINSFIYASQKSHSWLPNPST